MVVKCTIDEIRQAVEGVLDLFYASTGLEQIECEIEFVDNIYERKLELAVSDEMKQAVTESKEFHSGLNGTLIMPDEEEKSVIILVANHTINKELLFISTIIHELTHAHDFTEFIRDNNGNRDIENTMTLWSEFHARRMGYRYYRAIVTRIYGEASYEENIRHILEKECPYQLGILVQSLEKYQNDPYQYLYSIMQFLGRYSVWQDLYSESINENTLPKELIEGFGQRIIDLYRFLYENKTFDQVKDKLHELEILLRTFECVE